MGEYLNHLTFEKRANEKDKIQNLTKNSSYKETIKELNEEKKRYKINLEKIRQRIHLNVDNQKSNKKVLRKGHSHNVTRDQL